MKFWFRLAAFSFLFSVMNVAMAGSPVSGAGKQLQWQCWYDLGSHIRCMIDATSSAANFEAEEAPAELPFLVKAIWTDGLRKTTIRYTLDRPHSDTQSMKAFAEANVCGTYRYCTVIFSHRPPTMAQYIALVERSDPSGARQLAHATQEWTDRSDIIQLAAVGIVD